MRTCMGLVPGEVHGVEHNSSADCMRGSEKQDFGKNMETIFNCITEEVQIFSSNCMQGSD